jgi:ketosteroid isomerase-like protein
MRTLAATTVGLVALVTAALPAQAPGAWQSLVDAERAFAAHSVRTTMREAFLGHLSPRSVMFNPGPVNGIELYSRAPARPGQLNWAPEVVDIAASGDFGYSTGPHQFRQTPDGPVLRQGYFCSVWGRTGQEPWKVLVDLGISQPTPLSLEVAPRKPTGPPAVSAGRPAEARASLEAAERALAAALVRDQAAAYRAALAPQARLYRDGAAPAEGLEAALAQVARRGPLTRVSPGAFEIASSGDLAYVYGEFVLAGAASQASPLHYVRVWRHEADGWHVVLDVDTWNSQ